MRGDGSRGRSGGSVRLKTKDIRKKVEHKRHTHTFTKNGSKVKKRERVTLKLHQSICLHPTLLTVNINQTAHRKERTQKENGDHGNRHVIKEFVTVFFIGRSSAVWWRGKRASGIVFLATQQNGLNMQTRKYSAFEAKSPRSHFKLTENVRHKWRTKSVTFHRTG